MPPVQVQQWQKRPTPAIVAHRGASADAPENTLAAFKLAWQQGADAIEGDFHLTRDDRIVCHHDPHVNLRNGKTAYIKDMTLEELKALSEGRSLPTLQEVMDTVPGGKGIFMEVKCGPEILNRLTAELDGGGLADGQVTVISFNKEVIAGVKQCPMGIPAHWLVDFKGSSVRLQPSPGSIIETLDALKCDGVGLKADPRLSRGFVSSIHSAGYAVHVWTVDSFLMATRFRRLGVDSITTNIPGKLRVYLNA